MSFDQGTPVDVTITNLHSLPADVNLLAGWSSGALSMADLMDAMLSIHLVSASATRQAGQMNVYAYAIQKAGGSWPDIFSSGTPGSEGVATVRDARYFGRELRPISGISFDATNAAVGGFTGWGLARLWEAFMMPTSIALFITGNISTGTTAQLAATGSAISYTPIVQV